MHPHTLSLPLSASLDVSVELAADQEFSQQFHSKSSTDKNEKWKKCMISGSLLRETGVGLPCPFTCLVAGLNVCVYVCSGSTVHYKVTMEKKKDVEGATDGFTLKFTGVQAGRFIKSTVNAHFEIMPGYSWNISLSQIRSSFIV